MPRSKTALPTETKLDFTTISGEATIQVAASLTTRAQVEALVEQLDKLAMVLPEVTKRKPKKSTPARVARTNNSTNAQNEA